MEIFEERKKLGPMSLSTDDYSHFLRMKKDLEKRGLSEVRLRGVALEPGEFRGVKLFSKFFNREMFCLEWWDKAKEGDGA